METTFYVLGMFILRLGVPLAITLAIGYLLRRLDAKWEAEASVRREGAPVPAEVRALKTSEKPCWEIKRCEEERRAQCPACKAWDLPCWVARLRATGRLPSECPDCPLFAPSPAA